MRAYHSPLWLCLSLLCGGCNHELTKASSPVQLQDKEAFERTVKTLNAHRASLGLRLIREDWLLYRSLPTQDDWKIREGGFLAKSVFKDASGKVVSEEDYFYSGRQFQDREGLGWERITVHYDYTTEQVWLAYTGTNAETEAKLSHFLMHRQGPSTNIAGAMTTVKTATSGWRDAL